MALYICMGLISMKAVSSVKGIEYKQGRKVKLINTAYTIWLMTWAFITVYITKKYILYSAVINLTHFVTN